MKTTRRDFLNTAGKGILTASLSSFLTDAFGTPLNTSNGGAPIVK